MEFLNFNSVELLPNAKASAAFNEGDPKVKLGYPSSFYYFSVQIAV